VFPGADVKFYLDASAEERGKRRFLELKATGQDVELSRITREIEERDLQDSRREIAPLMRADDALSIDSSRMSIDEVINKMLAEITKRM
jgi:cytidylate kinase